MDSSTGSNTGHMSVCLSDIDKNFTHGVGLTCHVAPGASAPTVLSFLCSGNSAKYLDTDRPSIKLFKDLRYTPLWFDLKSSTPEYYPWRRSLTSSKLLWVHFFFLARKVIIDIPENFCIYLFYFLLILDITGLNTLLYTCLCT